MENPYELMEEIDLGSAELEEVQKTDICKFDFPAVSVTAGRSAYFYFNAAAKPLFEKFDKIKFFTTPEYVIFADGKGDWKNTFSVQERRPRLSDKSFSYYKATIPAAMKEKKLQPGCYKLYKCKQGFAFKRYEPLEVSNATA